MIRVAREVGSSEGLFVCPEGAACFAAVKSLRSAGKIVQVSVWSFSTRGPESSIWTVTRPVISLSHIRLPTKMDMRLAKGLCRLGVETSSEFECIRAQSFALVYELASPVVRAHRGEFHRRFPSPDAPKEKRNRARTPGVHLKHPRREPSLSEPHG
jgi:hypothetical protein